MKMLRNKKGFPITAIAVMVVAVIILFLIGPASIVAWKLLFFRPQIGNLSLFQVVLIFVGIFIFMRLMRKK